MSSLNSTPFIPLRFKCDDYGEVLFFMNRKMNGNMNGEVRHIKWIEKNDYYYYFLVFVLIYYFYFIIKSRFYEFSFMNLSLTFNPIYALFVSWTNKWDFLSAKHPTEGGGRILLLSPVIPQCVHSPSKLLPCHSVRCLSTWSAKYLPASQPASRILLTSWYAEECCSGFSSNSISVQVLIRTECMNFRFHSLFSSLFRTRLYTIRCFNETRNIKFQ